MNALRAEELDAQRHGSHDQEHDGGQTQRRQSRLQARPHGLAMQQAGNDQPDRGGHGHDSQHLLRG